LDVSNLRSGASDIKDHPRHKLDPSLEEERWRGNYKFKVCEPKHHRLNLLCPPCINEDQIKSHQKKAKVPVVTISLPQGIPKAAPSRNLDPKTKL
jgi:hypothetical protein